MKIELGLRGDNFAKKSAIGFRFLNEYLLPFHQVIAPDARHVAQNRCFADDLPKPAMDVHNPQNTK
jgi:hypothetical protein